MNRLSINATLDEPTILKIPAVYRTTIARNFLRLLQGRMCIMNTFQQLLNTCVVLLFQHHSLI